MRQKRANCLIKTAIEHSIRYDDQIALFIVDKAKNELVMYKSSEEFPLANFFNNEYQANLRSFTNKDYKTLSGNYNMAP